MTDATSRIKNLSKAIEALSGIPGSPNYYRKIEEALMEEIRNWKQENKTRATIHTTSVTTDDDIPF